jgi:aryl sulfotransferase
MPTLVRAPTRECRTPFTDSRRWAGYRPRPGDIVVATYPKCGTTWTQRIVDMLIHQSTAARPILETYPWLDATFFAPIERELAALESQTHRRAIKTHLPFDSLPIYDEVKYVHVARDGRDACFSFHNHQLGETAVMHEAVAAANGWALDVLAEPPPPKEPRDFYLRWIGQAETGEADPSWSLSFFDFEMTYWRERMRPNLLLVHYNDLLTDLAGEMRRISTFLDIDTPEDVLAEIVEAARFENMKSQGEALLPNIKVIMDHGKERFLNKGVNGRWRDVLTDDDLARYDALVRSRMTPGAAAWIEKGRRGAGEVREMVD